MDYMDVTEASKRWGVTDRRVRILCNEGKVDGAIKLGWAWIIPADAPKPSDGRRLRAIKTRNIRPGSVDIDGISRCQEEFPLDVGMKESKGLSAVIAKSIRALLSVSGEDVSERDIHTILSGKAVSHVSLEIHLVIINFRSLLLSFIGSSERINLKRIEELRTRFLQGINDINPTEYRAGLCRFPYRGEERAAIDMQMDAAFQQWEIAWQNYHPVIAASILYAEMLRIEPYEEYPEIFAYIVLAAVLLQGGILPPIIRMDDGDELRAAFLLAAKRGNYTDLSSFMEKRIFDSYQEAGNV